MSAALLLPSHHPISEKQAILLVGGVQFLNILDFMMVMPLGPDFATALHIPTSHLGYIGGMYTLAATFSGLLAALVLDKLDRRTALIGSLIGLSIATMLGGLAWNFESLLGARAIAGLFGGPVSAIGLAIIADIVPPQRRGQAMGKVMGAFSLASLLGVPFGLELAALAGWRAPFFLTSGLILLLTGAAWWFMPSMVHHRTNATTQRQRDILLEMLGSRANWQAFLLVAFGIGGAFMLIPNVATYLQHNLHFPREHMGWLYFAGGILSLVSMRIAGKLTDRIGASKVITALTAIFVLIVALGFISPAAATISPFIIFGGFMLATSARNVAVQALNSKVPVPARRASFSSLQTAVTHLAMSLGAFAASVMLTEAPDGTLEGIQTVALVTILLSAAIPFMARRIEAHVALQAHAKPLPQLDLAGD